MNKKRSLWYLYDFANSFSSIVLLFYYPLILLEKGAGVVWVGVSASIATLVLLLILPQLGAYSDRLGKRVHFITIASVIAAASLVVMAFLLQRFEILNTPRLILLSFFYVVFQVCHQGAFMFYSAMLRTLIDTEKRVKTSGIGLGIGQLGNVFALGIIGPIIGSSVLIIGLSGKPLALFLGSVFFLVLAFPFLRQKEEGGVSPTVNFSYIKFLKTVFKQKRIFHFLVGYSLLADAILTFQLYIAVYVKKIFNFSDAWVTYAGITGLMFGVIGGFLAHTLVRKTKDKERALLFATLLYVFCFGLCALIPVVPLFVFVGLALAGISYGLVFSLARTVYAEIAPLDGQGQYFSMYTVFERAASVVGPLLWILTFYALKNFGESIQYRGSILILMFVCIIGFYFVRKSKREAANFQ